MAAGRNKALLELNGSPLLLHSVETFLACCDRVLLVVAADEGEAVRGLLPQGVRVVQGGLTRHGSEWNALLALEPEAVASDVIAIHDAARPLVCHADVQAVLAAAAEHGAALLAEAADRPALEVDRGSVVRAFGAAELWRAQTPQAARAGWLFDAYRQADADGFDGTDTAAVLSRAGYPVRLVAATAPNPKVTLPADLALAEQILLGRAPSG